MIYGHLCNLSPLSKVKAQVVPMVPLGYVFKYWFLMRLEEKKKIEAISEGKMVDF